MSAGGPFDESTGMSGFVLCGAKGSYGDADRVVAWLPNGEPVNFYQIIPIYESEMNYKLEQGDADILFARMEEKGFPLVVEPKRQPRV